MFGPVAEGMRLFRRGCKVAVIGYSNKPNRIVHRIAKYLSEEGNQIVGINPNLAHLNGHNGVPVKASLSDLEKPVDVIQVFRNSAALPSLAREILSLPWVPRLVWCQQGVFDVVFQKELENNGIAVVMDACPYALRSYL